MSEGVLTIRQALDRIVELQKGLSIDDPIEQTVKAVYKYFPSRNNAAPARPFWMNTWTLRAQRRQSNGWDQVDYTVRSQLCVDDASLDRAADIATAFGDALMDALDRDITLNGGTARHDLRGADPTLALLEWSGKTYVGLDLYIDLTLTRIRNFGP